jgi:hypothetical protein
MTGPKWAGMKQATEKVTNQDSDIDANGMIYQELIGTITDPGTVDVTINWVPADTSHQLLLSLFDNQVHNWQIRGPIVLGSSPLERKFTFRFAAQMFDRPDVDLPLEKQMTLTLKLQLIGEPEPVTYLDPADGN